LKKPDDVTFEQFNFSPEMNKAIAELGFTSPTPIQIETLPILLKKPTDFLGLAATGTGKTAAFAIPLLESMKGSPKTVQALILCPTRELAKQTSEQINLLARYKKVKALAIYGGSDYGGQLRALKEGVAIVVGTPGRIIDHLERGTLNLNSLQTVVLDEADEMISMGFKEEIELILQKVSQEEKHQTWLFSATMSKDIRRIADNFLNNPKQIQVNKQEGVSRAVKQFFYTVREEEKLDALEKLIDQAPEFYGLIFCQTKALVVDITESLRSKGYAVDCLHGDMEQNARERTMKAFKAKTARILICTDVASRGLDVKELTHVVNYSLPRELDLYVHRIGRTGRGGAEGLALSLVSPSHMHLVSRIERATQSRMTKAQVPSDFEVLKVRLKKALNTFLEEPSKDSIGVLKLAEILADSEWPAALEAMSKEEIIARFLAKSIKAPQQKRTAAPGGFAARYDRGSERGDRGGDRRYDRGAYRGGERGGDRGSYRGADRSGDRAPFRGADRNAEAGAAAPASGERRAFKSDDKFARKPRKFDRKPFQARS
jgi:ATP-dependent RNA helicase DeaD